MIRFLLTRAGLVIPTFVGVTLLTFALIRLAPGAAVAGVFTRNRFCAAPVLLSKRHLKNQVAALVVNTGNANAGTGAEPSCGTTGRSTREAPGPSGSRRQPAGCAPAYAGLMNTLSRCAGSTRAPGAAGPGSLRDAGTGNAAAPGDASTLPPSRSRPTSARSWRRS